MLPKGPSLTVMATVGPSSLEQDVNDQINNTNNEKMINSLKI
ncbi:hypothetical protein GCM10011344_20890 [Dokdonia pacifica]|uniref:Uncharacterized protein n=1 Tax=Dokdonia pacifica TaxID=1627892 RepID=A0A238VMK0_9FLAO|nr:hypothetical protein GCM10011344_20890 [Dokdonia pacifica]SNR35456.1 hypothetical protein SAMN06265376_10144 [Dokdonia pacifica]